MKTKSKRSVTTYLSIRRFWILLWYTLLVKNLPANAGDASSVSSYTRYKIQKVQKVFSEKSPTLISQPASLSLGTHNYQSLYMFKIHEYAHFLNKQIRNPLIVGGDIGLCLAFSLSISWRAFAIINTELACSFY